MGRGGREGPPVPLHPVLAVWPWASRSLSEPWFSPLTRAQQSQRRQSPSHTTRASTGRGTQDAPLWSRGAALSLARSVHGGTSGHDSVLAERWPMPSHPRNNRERGRRARPRHSPARYLWKVCSLRASSRSSASTFPRSRPRTAVSSRLAGLMRWAVRRHTWISCFSSAGRGSQGRSPLKPRASADTCFPLRLPEQDTRPLPAPPWDAQIKPGPHPPAPSSTRDCHGRRRHS